MTVRDVPAGAVFSFPKTALGLRFLKVFLHQDFELCDRDTNNRPKRHAYIGLLDAQLFALADTEADKSDFEVLIHSYGNNIEDYI